MNFIKNLYLNSLLIASLLLSNEPANIESNSNEQLKDDYQNSEITTYDNNPLNLEYDKAKSAKELTIEPKIQRKRARENLTSSVKDEILFSKMYFGYLKDNANIFNDSFDMCGGIEKYQKVYVMGKEGAFYFVAYVDGNVIKTGYILAFLVNEIEDTYIEVDLSDETIKMYLDNKIVLNSKIVSGMHDVSDTREGYFGLTYKEKNATLTSYNSDGSLRYASFVDYWMPFDGNIGLHDAEYHTHEDGFTHGWRSKDEFGGDTYLYNGSHGCVNLLNEDAKFIYDHSDTGTKVLVHK